MTFKKGDKVRAIDNMYAYTCAKDHYEGVVVDVISDVTIRVKATKHDKLVTDHIHTVRAASFKKVSYPKIVITTDGKTTLARLYEDGKVTKNAEAVCITDDTFDFSIGAKLATQRLMGKGAPEEPKKYHPDPSIPHKFNIGDSVAIVSYGKCYGNYKEFIEANVPPAYRALWKPERFADSYARTGYRVVTYAKHEGNGRTLYYISNGEVAFIFDEDGLSKSLYNGKVVCLNGRDTAHGLYTPGKIYTFCNGQITTDSGIKMPSDPVSTIADWHDWSSADWLEIVE